MQQVTGARTADYVRRDEGFDEVYLRTYRRMVLLAFGTTGSLALAEEIAQDAFAQLYKRWDAITAKEAWLRRAVVSLATTWLRRHLLERRLSMAVPVVPD